MTVTYPLLQKIGEVVLKSGKNIEVEATIKDLSRAPGGVVAVV